ncbi:MAG: hypothetical protein HY264_01470 [Chloroflexi bacterium]|nr:hypothetical protein [Chloroflexota bacterium]
MQSRSITTSARIPGVSRRTLVLLAAGAILTLSLGAGVTVANTGRPHVEAENTFTKWITANPNLPGEVKDMGGIVGGDVGDGAFVGTVLGATPITGGLALNAIYGFNGSAHSFKALMHIEQVGAHAVLIGVITDGWFKGHLVRGEYTMGTCSHGDVNDGTCFRGTLDVIQALQP